MRISHFFIVLICLFSTPFPRPVIGQELYEYKRPKEVQEKMLAELLERLDSSEHISPEDYQFFCTEFLEKNETFPGHPVKAVIYVPLKNTYKDSDFEILWLAYKAHWLA